MNYNIALLKGDGIGPEIVESAVAVLDAVGQKFGHTFAYEEYLAGGCALDEAGEPLPQETIEGCRAADAVLLGAVGGPKWDSLPGDKRPECALLGLRLELGLFSNLRPVKLYPALVGVSPLRADIVEAGFDILIVRELTGGIYFGKRGRQASKNNEDEGKEGKGNEAKNNEGEIAFDTESYSTAEIERIAHVAFAAARTRSKRVTSVDKANVLESSRLWREVVHRVGEEYPDIELLDMLVDNAAMQLIRNPAQFDVILTSNMFGDILSDEASQLTGSIGLLPSASLGATSKGLYEPIHGSAPDIAGQGLANPLATILSAAMMLRYSFGLAAEADCVEAAVEAVLEAGCRTADLAGAGETNTEPLTTAAMTKEVLKCL
ncbi:MAG: 3-isopropylmalate dehydrogenase [Coriobacteriales bacterium]|jgi:3-isopropylmalate dehydrogenase|nr:3-isopropylmalate dehydrogenase [Coriobacteriales bacterium]